MTQLLIVAGIIGVFVGVIIFLNWREKKSDREIAEITRLPFEKDKRIKPK